MSALEVSDSMRLQLSANSTRRAPWDAKLGHQRVQPRMSLRSLSPYGGFVSMIDVIIVRKYPVLFREKFKEQPAVVRNQAEEELAEKKHKVSD